MDTKKEAPTVLSFGNTIKYFSALSFIWLFSFPTRINIVFSIVLSLFAVLCLSKGWVGISDKDIQKVPVKTCFIIFAVTAVLGLCFFKRWSVPDSTIMVPDMIMACSDFIIGAVAVIVSAGSYLFMFQMASYTNKCGRSHLFNECTGEQIQSLLFYLFLTAAAVITICSKSSILYPFNDAADGNCFFTVGKSLLNGKVLYRDLFEQKGPYIYFLHSFAYLISGKSFLGVYFLEIISAFLFLCIIFKTLRLFHKDISILIIAIFAAFIFSQGGFTHGDEIEEFCLPSVALTNYYLLRFIKKETHIKPREMLLVGILAGGIFWSKYTICGYFACWYVIVAANQIKERRMNSLIKCFFAGLGGVVLSTIPVLLYFTLNNALSSLWDVYFIANLVHYNNVNVGIIASLFGIMRNLVNGAWVSLRYNLVNCILLIVGLFWMRTCRERTLYVILAAATFLFTCIGMDPQKYYTFYFAAFAAPGILFFWEYIKEIRDFRKTNLVISLVVCIAISISISPNVYMMGYTREDLPQYRFADTIKASGDTTLLNYGFLDGGYYTTSETVPNCRYFHKTNMNLPEQMEVQDYYVNNGLTEFVVCRGLTIDSDYYELCDTYTYFFENAYRTDYLYRLKHH